MRAESSIRGNSYMHTHIIIRVGTFMFNIKFYLNSDCALGINNAIYGYLIHLYSQLCIQQQNN